MNLQRHFLIIAVFIFFSLAGYSQGKTKIDSLRSTISSLKDTTKANALFKLGTELYRVHADSGLPYWEEAYEISKAHNYLKGEAKYYSLIGSRKHSIGQSEASIDDLNKYLELSEELNSKVEIASAHHNLGTSYSAMGETIKAMKHLKTALKMRKELKDTLGVAQTANNIGIDYYYHNDYPNALKYMMEAMEMREKSGNERAMAESYNNVGIMHKMQGNLDKTLEYFEKSLEIRKKLDDRSGMSASYNNIGVVYEEKGDSRASMESYKMGLKIAKEIGDWGKIAQYTNNVGIAYSKMKDYPQALEYNLKALEIYETKVSSPRDMASAISAAAVTYFNLKQLEKADEYGKRALSFAEQNNLTDQIAKACEILAEVLVEKGDYKKAFEYYKRFNAMNDSLAAQQRMQEMNKMTNQYELDKQRKELEFKQMQQSIIQQEKLKRQKVYLFAFIGGFLLVLVFAMVVLRNYRQKRKANEMLQERNVEITRKNLIIEEKNKDITDSILYAKRIQQAILPPKEDIKAVFPDSFILFKPRDIVSGDFYWFSMVNDLAVLAVADCTGHGVPGAFMSLIGYDLLNQIVADESVTRPAQALKIMDRKIQQSLNKNKGQEQPDGMDIALAAFNRKENTVMFSGAFRPLILIRNGEMMEYKANKFSLGGVYDDIEKEFTDQTLKLQKGDALYMYSDGFADQFGGNKGKKFMNKRMKELLVELNDQPMKDQGNKLKETIEEWQGDLEQVDDICVIGVRV